MENKMNTHDEYEIVSGDCAEQALLREARDIRDAMITIQLTDGDSSPEPLLGKEQVYQDNSYPRCKLSPEKSRVPGVTMT